MTEAPQDLRTLEAPQREAKADRFAEGPKYNPAAARESVRGNIAKWLVWTLVGVVAVVVLASIAMTWRCAAQNACAPEFAEMKSIRLLLELILTPLVGLVGAVTGFYFGEKSASAGDNEK